MKILIEFVLSIYLLYSMYKGIIISKKVYQENKIKQEYITKLTIPIIFILITQCFIINSSDAFYVVISIAYIISFISFIFFFVFRIYILQFKNRL